jgi:hypothetical protein
MGLIKDNRPRDCAYLARFSQEDLPALESMAKHIRETHDVKTIELFNSNCERVLHGLDPDIGTPIPTQVTKTGDLVVNAGLDQCIKIILGTSSTRWSHIGNGVGGGSAPAVSNTALNGENIVTRIAISTHGWAEAVGMRILFGGVSGQLDPSEGGNAPMVVAEMGLYNGAASGAVLLNRSSFVNNAPQQDMAGGFGEVAAAPIVLSAIIEFCPVV